MTEEDRVIAIARRGQIDPESLTEDEIRLVALHVLMDLDCEVKATTPEQN